MHLNIIRLSRLAVLALILLFVSIKGSLGQSLSEELEFSRYLVSKNLYQDNVLLIKQIKSTYDLSGPLADSLNYSLARSYYYMDTDSSLAYFSKVTDGAPHLYNKSQFFRAYFFCEKDSLGKAYETLQLINAGNDNEMKCLQLTEAECIAVLMDAKDGTWQGYQDSITVNCVDNANYIPLLAQNLEPIKHYKKKSPFLAGALSFFVPGLGRVYSGKPAQGLMSFLPFVIMGLQTYEGYRNGGFDDARFITYGSILAIFYLGNVWGSALSAKIKQKEVYDEVHYQVMATLKVPVDRMLRTGR